MGLDGVSLVGLVEEARQRALLHHPIKHWHKEAHAWRREAAIDAECAAVGVMDEACGYCLLGQFGCAWARVGPVGARWDDPLEEIHDCPAWITFVEVVRLAERIDCFLAVLESDRLTAPLARDCRGNLDLLGVLADWCHDGNRPLAAAEARHLLALAQAHQRG